ncbi:MAG: alpha-ketoglutarate-dependent dioxygenase AlkB [Flavobacterium sp.]|uniref:alpha-ketoglutarate-dependent dioxygenase AlkB family protein n=1 Tax=Flavobacterium sp. TaxID=239 RepID=UPI002FC5903D
MTLFNDTDLFMSGTNGRKDFELPDADVILIDNFFTKEEADYYYEVLLNNTNWKEYEMPMYDKIVTAPRMISWFQDKSDTIHSGDAPELTKELKEIRERVQVEVKLNFNAVLLNLYRNGNDGVSWHSDKINRSDAHPVTASVTFGETRMFRLKHKFRKEVPFVEIPLHHGSFLLMAGTTNSFWEHQVPKTAKKVLPRINLTFRKVIK